MVECTCGHPVASGDRFCAACGASLESGLEHTGAITSIIPTGSATTSGGLAAVGSGSRTDIPSGSAMLLVHRGPGEGSEFHLPATADLITVGRNPDSDVFLDDVTVSRQHATFRRSAEGWSVSDAGSLNGTYVNRKRVDDRRLAGGDEVQIGKFRFIFLVGVEHG